LFASASAVLIAYKRIFVSTKVAIEFFPFYAIRSGKAFDFGIGFFLETFQSFKFSLLFRERFQEASYK
jgi:hypothetical protein